LKDIRIENTYAKFKEKFGKLTVIQQFSVEQPLCSTDARTMVQRKRRY